MYHPHNIQWIKIFKEVEALVDAPTFIFFNFCSLYANHFFINQFSTALEKPATSIGYLLVIRLPSVTTDASTTFPPAFFKSTCESLILLFACFWFHHKWKRSITCALVNAGWCLRREMSLLLLLPQQRFQLIIIRYRSM